MGNGLRGGLRRSGGLTLLECLITLAIVAILVGVGVPAYRDQLAAARARAGAQQLYAAMQYARSMAQAHGTVVTLCPVIDPSDAGASSKLSKTLILFYCLTVANKLWTKMNSLLSSSESMMDTTHCN